MKKHLAVIPARGGSKRLPGKNLMSIAGKPLIAWTIEAALECQMFDKVIVSTDSEAIAKIAIAYGAEVPFLRPPELAGDQTTTIDVLNHLVETMRNDNPLSFSHLTLLQPTSPLRSASNISDAIKLLDEKEADAIISICKTEHSPLWSNTLPPDNSLTGFIAENIQKTPSQNLPEYFRLNGALYICNIRRMLEEKTLYLSSNCFGYVMSRKNSIDIDDQVDFDLADIYLTRSKASI
ncbi:MAG: acylneuraminate cytidylyltransferase family protein [Bacteroidales bacterium]|nr:acylneuraminate cytidylyltransferase family protein [Bacteroidales bacterium]